MSAGPFPLHIRIRGVWVTLELQVSKGATLKIYNAAPDVSDRECLVTHSFPLKEPVLPRPVHLEALFSQQPHPQPAAIISAKPPQSQTSGFLLVALITQAVRLATRLMHTIY